MAHTSITLITITGKPVSLVCDSREGAEDAAQDVIVRGLDRPSPLDEPIIRAFIKEEGKPLEEVLPSTLLKEADS
jgi:hypothetical protein